MVERAVLIPAKNRGRQPQKAAGTLYDSVPALGRNLESNAEGERLSGILATHSREPASRLEFSEEIVIESYRDAAKKLCINASLAQNLVNIRAVAAYFLCKPGCRPTLPTEFIANQRPDVNLNATFFSRR